MANLSSTARSVMGGTAESFNKLAERKLEECLGGGALAENQDLTPSTHVAAQNHPSLSSAQS